MRRKRRVYGLFDSMPIYKMVMEKARWEGISLPAFMSVLTLEGECLWCRAKRAHLGGHLPAFTGDRGVSELSHLAANILLPDRERLNVFVDAGVGLVGTHAMMIPRIKVLTYDVSPSISLIVPKNGERDQGLFLL